MKYVEFVRENFVKFFYYGVVVIMLEKLDFIEEKYNDLSRKISDIEVISDPKLYQKYCKEHSALEEIVTSYREYKSILKNLQEDKDMVMNEKLEREMKELAEEEIKQLEEERDKKEEELKVLLIPKDQIGRASCRERV